MRVYIREPQISDVKEFVEKNRASLKMHRPWVFPATTLAAFRSYIECLSSPRYAGFFICRKEDDAIVGTVNLSEIILGPMKGAFVGYWLYHGSEGHGYMTEGLSLVFDYAFDVLGLHRLEVNIQPTNTESIALVNRLGLRKEGFSPKYLKIGGEWRDHERWALLAKEWKSRDDGLGSLGG